MMQMIKYGVAAAGIIVPPLAHFRIGEGVEAVQNTLNLVGHSFGSLVDHTIAYLQDQENGTANPRANQSSKADIFRLARCQQTIPFTHKR